mgnify:FL=1
MGHPIVVHKPKASEPEVFGATFAEALALICKDDAVPDALILLLGCSRPGLLRPRRGAGLQASPPRGARAARVVRRQSLL